MKKHVGLQLGVLHEALTAHLTLKGFLPSVDANVPLQVLLERESRSTRLTRECFPLVDCLVRPERPPLCKSFATHCALVRMLPSVNASVALESERIPETLPALGALVWLFHTVHGLVSAQVLFSFKGLPAGGADERPRVCVYDLMCF